MSLTINTPATLPVLMLATSLAIVAGCESPAARTHRDKIQQRKVETETRRQEERAAEAKARAAGDRQRAENIAANWSRLKAGMSIDEVNGLIGPLENLGMFKAVISAGNSKAFGSSSVKTSNEVFSLEFTNGKLSKWELKP